MAIKDLFSAEHCRRITWAIIDDGRSYFDNVKSTLDFESGASIVFPQSFLVDIIKNVRYSIPVEQGNFPKEWLSQSKATRQEIGQRTLGSGTTAGRGSDKQVGQQYGGQGNYQGTGTLGGGYSGGYLPPNNYQPRDWRSGWNNERHPKIKTLMVAYLERTNGRVLLSKLLTAAGKKQTDLPTLPSYIHPNGWSFIYWSFILGRCTYRDCRFHLQGGHPSTKDITDNFADKVVDTLNKGVISLCGTCTSPPVGSPSKKAKITEQESTTI
jgi:hypothetical protein